MESKTMTCPLCDPIEKIVKFFDSKTLAVKGDLMIFPAKDLKYSKAIWGDKAELIYIDDLGFVYRLVVRHKEGQPVGYWLYDCNAVKGEYYEI